MASRFLPLYLSERLYRSLAEQAKAAERDPIQQACWLLREALSKDAPECESPKPQEEVAA